MLALLLLALLPQQRIDFRAPPAQPYTLRAMVPGMRPPLTVPGCVTDSRLVLELEDGTPVTEIVAQVPAGTRRADVVQGSVPGPAPARFAIPYLSISSTAVLVIDPDGPGGLPDSRVSLTAPASAVRRYRSGRVMVTVEHHADLGALGGLEWWVSARGRQIDVELLWHRASVGADVLFRSARIETTGAWTSNVPDPARQGDYLVKAGWHVIPQQFARPFFFTIHVRGETPEPDRVGVADWSRGGFMPSGFPVSPLPAHDWAGQLAEARWKLASLQPVESWEPAPSSWLWPASGVQTGGAGGGIDRCPLDGVRWATSHGAPQALECYLIEFLRGMSRARIRLDPDGSPLDLPNSGAWRFWDGFQDEGPWHWSAYPRCDGAYDPRLWADHDTASMERRLNEAWVLVWLANSPIARRVTLEAATRARLTFWEGRPMANSWGPGRGSDIGIWQANCGLAIAAARCLGMRAETNAWRNAFLDHLRTVQMPSGAFTAREGGYPSDREPFCGQYLLQGAEEFAYLQLAAYSLGERDVVRRAAHGMVGLATDDDDPGLYYFTATGRGAERYFDDHDWPAALDAEMGVDPDGATYYTAWHMGIPVALAFATDAPEASELLRRFLVGEGPMPPNPGAVLDSWGLQAPEGQTRAPVENYWPIRGQL